MINFKSIKYRIMVWTTVIIAVVFIPFFFIMSMSIQAMMLSSMDSRLEFLALRHAERMRDEKNINHGSNMPPPKKKNLSREFLPPIFFDCSGVPVNMPGNIVLDSEKRKVLPLIDWSKLPKPIEKPYYTFVEHNSVYLRILYFPMNIDGRDGVIQVTVPATELNELKLIMGKIVFFFIPSVIIVSIFGGWIITIHMMKPVKKIADSVSEINESDLSRRLDESGGDEFASLAITINKMLVRLENAFKDIKRAFEREKQFTSDASHELRTPLTVIKANTSLALRAERDINYYKKTVEDVDKATDSMLHIVESLLLLARADSGRFVLQKEAINVSEFVDSIICTNFVGKKERNIISEIDDYDMCIKGDFNFLKRFLFNLIENSIKFTPNNGRIVINASLNSGIICLSVSDNGCGIAEEYIPKLTERFYRIGNDRNRNSGGSGLGLSICKTIAEIHGGKLEIKSKIGEGTVVSGYFPAA